MVPLDPEPPTEPSWVNAKGPSRFEMELREEGLEEWEIDRALRDRDAELEELQFAEDR